MIIVNLDKAKTITKDRLRAEREPLLAAQDVAFQRALETGADTTAIVAEKQRLRDITKLADQATTLEELTALGLTQDEVKAIQELNAKVEAQALEIQALKATPLPAENT